jgi:hypothetical protein
MKPTTAIATTVDASNLTVDDWPEAIDDENLVNDSLPEAIDGYRDYCGRLKSHRR